jgi:phosphatidylserine/phosphatidylglycerophosphate/cardiolipin synthase-like enzyme
MNQGGNMNRLALAILLVVSSGATGATQILQTCFAPDQNCEQVMDALVNETASSIDMAAYNFTLRSLKEAVIKAQMRHVKVRIVADPEMVQSRTSQIKELKAAGIDVRTWPGEHGLRGLMHNKYVIYDGQKLQTGSFNFTVSATKRNAENFLVLKDDKTLKTYQADFDRIWSISVPLGSGD